MKVIVDAGFPPLDDPRCVALRVELYRRKKRYGYKELKDGTVYIYFPKVNPISWVYQHIKYYIWTRHTKEKKDD
jgi:hypothetical protein